MSNILNSRITKLIKDDLVDYGQHLLGLLGFFILLFIINVILNRGIAPIPEAITINLGNIGEIVLEGIVNYFLTGFFVIIMFIAGCVSGYELPQHVRKGIARKEYFTATTISATIISLLIAPLLILTNVVFNLLGTSQSLFYNAFYIGDLEISLLITQFLMYTTLFLLGYFIAAIWQRTGWAIGIVITLILLSMLGFLVWQLGFFTLSVYDYHFWIRWSFSNIFLLGMTMTLAIGTYTLIKEVSVKLL